MADCPDHIRMPGEVPTTQIHNYSSVGCDRGPYGDDQARGHSKALNVLEDEVLEDYDRAAIEGTLNRHKAYLTEIETREDGYRDHALKKYVLAKTR